VLVTEPLAQYHSDNLTREQAKKIHQALSEAEFPAAEEMQN